MDVTVTGAVPDFGSKVESELKSVINDGVYRLHDNIRNVTDLILTSTSLTQAKIAESQFAAAKEFALVALQAEKNTSAVLAAMSATELRKVQDQLDEAREKNEHYSAQVSFGDKFSAIQSQLIDLKQEQKSTNQAISFGSGYIGPQSNTSNQVR